MGRYMSTTAAGRLLGVSRECVRLWAQHGQIPGSFRGPGGQWRIPEDAIDLVKARGMAPGSTSTANNQDEINALFGELRARFSEARG